MPNRPPIADRIEPGPKRAWTRGLTWGLAGGVLFLVGVGAFLWSTLERDVDRAAAECVREQGATSRLLLPEAATRLAAACAGTFAEEGCAAAIRRAPRLRGRAALASVRAACRAAYCPLPKALYDSRLQVCEAGDALPWVVFAALAHSSDRRPFSLSPERSEAFTAADRAVAMLFDRLEFDAPYVVTMTMDGGDQVAELRSREGAVLATVRGVSSSLDAEGVFSAIPAGGLADAGVELRVERQVLFGPVRHVMSACVQRHCRLSLEMLPTAP